jgi:general transcription factor 3C polypeptide 5 (transcription factor C subunit 1)
MSNNESQGPPLQRAPEYIVPNEKLLLVEHPFLVKNPDKAIDMLGGATTLASTIGSNRSLSLKFDPEDAVSRPVNSLNSLVDNPVLRITVPKRIGKRKRGSGDLFLPIQPQHPVTRDAQYLLQSMSDNKDNTQVDVVGKVQRSHVWRSIPDFDYSTRGSDFLVDIQSKILPQRYDLLKQWHLPKTTGLQNTEVAPPPLLSTATLPHPYVFHQRPPDQDSDPDGVYAPEIRDSRAKLPQLVTFGPLDDFPTTMQPSMPPLKTLSASVRRLHSVLQDLFQQRPIWSRRALRNHLPERRIGLPADTAIRYLAYNIRAGAWSRTYCAYGIDPRSHPRYRKFQTLIVTNTEQKPDGSDTESDEFDEETQQPATAASSKSHIFTGHGPVFEDGSTFQFCDLEDPQLKGLVDVDEGGLAKNCDPEIFGWYGNGTASKIRIILRIKINALRRGEAVPDSDFDRIVTLPEHFIAPDKPPGPNDELPPGYLPEDASAREKTLAAIWRQGCYNNGRMTLKLPEDLYD